MKRIVITGMGLVSPLGCGTEAVWQSLLAGKSGISALPEEMVQDISCKVAGQVPTREQDPQHGFTLQHTVYLSRSSTTTNKQNGTGQHVVLQRCTS